MYNQKNLQVVFSFFLTEFSFSIMDKYKLGVFKIPDLNRTDIKIKINRGNKQMSRRDIYHDTVRRMLKKDG